MVYRETDGDNCGWVDFVQWTGPSPAPDPNNWNQIEYKYDVYGRRSEKKVDGYATRYVYDGAQVIAEYDGNNYLLRKYIYGLGIDQPVCMIEVAEGKRKKRGHSAFWVGDDPSERTVSFGMHKSAGTIKRKSRMSPFSLPLFHSKPAPSPSTTLRVNSVEGTPSAR